MTEIITFYKVSQDDEKSEMFGFIEDNKFIIKQYRYDWNDIVTVHRSDYDDKVSFLDHVKKYFKRSDLSKDKLIEPTVCNNHVGKYYPRIYRKGLNQWSGKDFIIIENFDLNTLNQGIVNCRILIKKLNQLFETISFDESNFKTFGFEIRNLLLLACMEVESAWNGIFIANGYISKNGFYTTNDYVKLCDPLYLKEYDVSFHLYPNIKPLKPFCNWEISNPTKSLPWYNDYNKTKHDRESNINLATFEATINSISAVLIMMYAQYGPIRNIWDQNDFLTIKLKVPEYKLEDYYIPKVDPNTCIHIWEKMNYKF
jgi:hypothetical protein